MYAEVSDNRGIKRNTMATLGEGSWKGQGFQERAHREYLIVGSLLNGFGCKQVGVKFSDP